jgi:glycosyltransferase involved in cell wall biosynthesis
LKFYRRCQHLIGNTRAIVDYAVSQGWPRERAHYLPNFVPDPRAAAVAREPALERPYGAPLALALGRLHPNKGFDLLIDALAMTEALHMWIAGEGPLRDDLARQAERLGLGGRVRFLGWRDDVSALMAAADFLVCPSRHEPLGNVVIEGWAAGLPVVATASDGPAGLIEEGSDGLLVPLTGEAGGAAEALADAMQRLAGDAGLRARLAEGGRAAYEASFTEAVVVGRYRAFFDEVAG